MHIEPGWVEGGKMLLGAATAAGSLGVAIHATGKAIRAQGLGAVILGTALATSMTLVFFQLLPHPPVGVSEVHLILGSTLLLILARDRPHWGWRSGCCCRGFYSHRLTCRSTG